MNDNFLKEISILVVEDSNTERKILVDYLKKYFPNIYEANNGEEALEIYRSDIHIDIIISDINMPTISGLDLLKIIRNLDMHIPFILVTSKVELQYLLDAVDLNVSAYLEKPVNFNTLLQKIDFLCEKKYYKLQLENKQKEVENYIEAVDKAALIFKMSYNGDISYMNKAMRDVTGYKQKDIPALKFSDIIHPQIENKFLDQSWEHIKNGKLWQGNTKFITKENETFYLNNTVFKVNDEKEEFITIAFLTTKENLEKRDFHKKVLMKFKEANQKEFELNEKIKILEKKSSYMENLYLNTKKSLDIITEKNAAKERQLIYYEMQGDNVSQKYEKFMSLKKDELQNHIRNLKIERQKNIELKKQENELLEIIQKTKLKNKKLIKDLANKNALIKELNEKIK